jgi:hypothetical protein
MVIVELIYVGKVMKYGANTSGGMKRGAATTVDTRLEETRKVLAEIVLRQRRALW